MKRAYFITAIIVLGIVLAAAPRILAVVVVLTVVAVLVVRQRLADEDGTVDSQPDPTLQNEGRIEAALRVGRRELGLPEEDDGGAIVVHGPNGPITVGVGYVAEVPFVAVRVEAKEATEMTFVIRRRRSTLDLPPLVDNTPLKTAGFEYRLRLVDIDPECQAFAAATNRPRLFNALLDSGLSGDVAATMDHPLYRLEDIVYGGAHITILLQPAADPADQAFVTDTLAFARPILDRLTTFLDQTYIPTSRS